MSLAVYSKVGSLLQAAGVGLEELRGRIAARYGRDIDERTLAALMQDGRVQRPDIELLEAIALTLDVRVDDLLDVRDVGMTSTEFPSDDDLLLDHEREARLHKLKALRDGDDRPLTEAETDELQHFSQRMTQGAIATMAEEGGGVLRGDGVDGAGEGRPQGRARARARPPAAGTA